ncbi:Thiol-disulfide oxidoreductase resA [Kingella potus]|uniref:Thiol-disulfide oxidoreductase resA n=1 Tax=Kingella potus TaxID=265175 RepID=A0A377R0J3_9NEIS|nr:TlpA disulfide reductase family protein [Kingella potus]UOP00487.1 TlpA family protein disulfide reductase [Kingella potus]STR02438.1 Thiol-disulfide oxidoreductase resA [Kingella potus]
MKKILTAAALLAVAALLALVLIPSDKPAPAFVLSDLDGRTITDARLQGRVSFVNFWFPSCPGCVSEMPKIIDMSRHYKNQSGFQILAVAEPYDPESTVRTYVREHGIDFAVMYDADKAAARAFGTAVYPTSFLIDKQGRVLKTFVGEPDFAELYRQIDSELAK